MELITDVVKTRNHGYDVIVGGELFTDYSDHPRKLVTNPKLKSTGAGRYQLLSPLVGWLTASSLLKDFSPKSQDAVVLWQRLRSVALTYDWSWWYPSGGAIDRCSNIWASLPGAGYGQFEHKADSLIAKIQRSGRKRSERLMYEQSHRDYLRSGYLHHRLPVMGC